MTQESKQLVPTVLTAGTFGRKFLPVYLRREVLIISFAKTINEFCLRRKTVTRRRWTARTAARFRKGTIHEAWSQTPRVKGAHRIGSLIATEHAYLEKLQNMPQSDLQAEGGLCETVEEFIRLIDGEPDELVWVCRFDVVEVLPCLCVSQSVRACSTSRQKDCPCWCHLKGFL